MSLGQYACAPRSISDSLIVPVVSAFQASYPSVRVQVRITERLAPSMADDVDIAFKVGAFIDASLVVRKLLSYRESAAVISLAVATWSSAVLMVVGLSAWVKTGGSTSNRAAAVHPRLRRGVWMLSRLAAALIPWCPSPGTLRSGRPRG